jgi:hypothetical protein
MNRVIRTNGPPEVLGHSILHEAIPLGSPLGSLDAGTLLALASLTPALSIPTAEVRALTESRRGKNLVSDS